MEGFLRPRLSAGTLNDRFLVGDVARELHRHPSTIISYEKRGIIPKPARDPASGYRIWTREQVERAKRALALIPDVGGDQPLTAA